MEERETYDISLKSWEIVKGNCKKYLSRGRSKRHARCCTTMTIKRITRPPSSNSRFSAGVPKRNNRPRSIGANNGGRRFIEAGGSSAGGSWCQNLPWIDLRALYALGAHNEALACIHWMELACDSMPGDDRASSTRGNRRRDLRNTERFMTREEDGWYVFGYINPLWECRGTFRKFRWNSDSLLWDLN